VHEPLISEARRREDGKGRPRRQARKVLEETCWMLRTGAKWADPPERYSPYKTHHCHFFGTAFSASHLEAVTRAACCRPPGGTAHRTKQPGLQRIPGRHAISLAVAIRVVFCSPYTLRAEENRGLGGCCG
jgi:transposase